MEFLLFPWDGITRLLFLLLQDTNRPLDRFRDFSSDPGQVLYGFWKYWILYLKKCCRQDKAIGHFLNLHQSYILPSSVFLLYPPTKRKKKKKKKLKRMKLYPMCSNCRGYSIHHSVYCTFIVKKSNVVILN